MSNKSLLKTLGPGILFASTCIGVSHLVQSTKAGANYGFELVWAIMLANLFKYPFFEFTSRYANATGTSIIDGYRKLGKGVLWLYMAITVSTMFFVCAVVGVITAGFLDNLLDIKVKLENIGLPHANLGSPILVFVVCIGILLAGKYKLLDSMIKIIGAVLLTSTLLAFVLALIKGPAVDFDVKFINFNDSLPLFVVPLMGWMPTALDLSAWNSLWTVARIKQTGYHPKLKETMFDFNFGYIASAVLALCFVTLGAYLMYETGNQLPKSAGDFSARVVNMYTEALGDWSYWVIAPAAFSIMFGTAIAVFDGYARSMERMLEILLHHKKGQEELDKRKNEYNLTLILVGIISFGILYFTVYDSSLDNTEGFGSLVDFTTAFSFVVAPIIAVINFILVQKRFVGEEFEPPVWKKILGYVGIVFLTAFSVFYFIYEG